MLDVRAPRRRLAAYSLVSQGEGDAQRLHSVLRQLIFVACRQPTNPRVLGR